MHMYLLEVEAEVEAQQTAVAAPDRNNIPIIFKICAVFTNFISEINNRQVDSAQDLDVVMPMYNLIEWSGNYSKISGSLWQYYKDVPSNTLTDSKSFKFKFKITGNTNAEDTKNAEIRSPLKYLSNFWRTLEIPLINCKNNLILTWSKNCVISTS